MTNGGGPGHHAKAKKKPPAGKAGKSTAARKWLPSKLKAAAKRAPKELAAASRTVS